MMLKLLSVLLYCLRWLAWAFHYLIIWPAAALMLLIVLLFRLEDTTPGKELAREIASVTRDVSPGEYRLFICPDEPLEPFTPDLTKDTSIARSLPAAPSAVCQEPPSAITDENGYAAHIDGGLSAGKGLWIVMSIVFAGLALLTGHYPRRSGYVFVSVDDDRGYIRHVTARPERGMGQYFVHPVHKKTDQHRGFDVYASSLTLPDVVQGDECTRSGNDEK